MTKKTKLGVGDEPVETPVEDVKSLGTMGPLKVPITYLGKKVGSNGLEYNDVHLADGTTYLMTDEDLKKQLST